MKCNIYDTPRRIISKMAHIGIRFLSIMLPKKGRIYMIHDIASDETGEFVLTPTDFEHFIQAHVNQNFIRLEDIDKATDFIALTIDDVPEGFFKYGFPILKQYKIPFTVFVNISLLDSPGYLSTEMLREISNCELSTIGSHGLSHGYFKDLPPDEIPDYFFKSKTQLEKICNTKVSLFAFPFGSLYACGYSNKRKLLQAYDFGFGTISTQLTKPSLLPKYFLPRINLSRNHIWQTTR